MTLSIAEPVVATFPNEPIPTAASSPQKFLLLLDNYLEESQREPLLKMLIAGCKIVRVTHEHEALQRLTESAFEGVIASLRDLPESLAFLTKAAAARRGLRLFLRADPDEINAATAERYQILPETWNASLLEDAISRSFALAKWEQDAALTSVLSYIHTIPTLPALYTQITAALQKEDCPAEEIAHLVAKDPAITAKLLQCVNSSYVGLNRCIADPQEAVMLFGTHRLRALVLLSSLFVRFDGTKCTAFSIEDFFTHSMKMATWCSMITMQETRNKKLADMSFTAGLLRDFGILLLAANLPESYDQILQMAKQRQVGIERIEQETYGATHAGLGGLILAKWGLPFCIVSAVGWHSSPHRSDDMAFSPLTSVHIATAIDTFARTHVLTYDRTYLEKLGVTAAKVEQISQRLLSEDL